MAQHVMISDSNGTTAEICGIILNLTLLLQQTGPPASVHIMCDNQYAIKSCLKLCKPHRDHVTLFHSIQQSVHYVSPTTNVHFHWISSHTDHTLHSQVDHTGLTKPSDATSKKTKTHGLR